MVETSKSRFEQAWKRCELYHAESSAPLNHESLQLGLEYVDLYLIHFPGLVKGSLENAWREFEKIKEDGLAKCTFFHSVMFIDQPLSRRLGALE